MVTIASIQSRVRDGGFASLPGKETRALLAFDDAAWAPFAASWNDLALDAYLLERGMRRRRRHAVYAIAGDAIEREAHQPHFQGLEYNALQGGIERWFEPIDDAIGRGEVLLEIIRLGARVFAPPPDLRVRVEVHQFRIEPRSDEAGHPTPEGVHRDGVDWVLVVLVSRQNIASGTTTIHDSDGRELGAFTLTDPLDAAFVDDARVAHGVTAVHAVDPMKPAHRDVLVVTYRLLPASS